MAISPMTALNISADEWEQIGENEAVIDPLLYAAGAAPAANCAIEIFVGRLPHPTGRLMALTLRSYRAAGWRCEWTTLADGEYIRFEDRT